MPDTKPNTYWAITGLGYGRSTVSADDAIANYIKIQRRNYSMTTAQVLDASWGKAWEVSGEVTGFVLDSVINWIDEDDNRVEPRHAVTVGNIGDVPDWARDDEPSTTGA